MAVGRLGIILLVAFAFGTLPYAAVARVVGVPTEVVVPENPGAIVPLPVADPPWDPLIRLDVGDLADRDTRGISDKRNMLAVRVCAEENTVRIRRGEIRLSNGKWQRLFLPLALKAGECSKPIEVLGGPRRIRAVQFDYEAFSAGYDRAALVVYGQAEIAK